MDNKYNYLSPSDFDDYDWMIRSPHELLYETHLLTQDLFSLSKGFDGIQSSGEFLSADGEGKFKWFWDKELFVLVSINYDDLNALSHVWKKGKETAKLRSDLVMVRTQQYEENKDG